MSQKDKGKQSNNIHKQKRSKIQNNRRIEKSLQMAQKRGTEILQVSNPKTFGNWTSDFNIVSFPKDAFVNHCAGSRWMSYSWKSNQKYLQKYH
jgi:hypothetical protein